MAFGRCHRPLTTQAHAQSNPQMLEPLLVQPIIHV
jgi:hypothetical protein